MIEFLQFVLSGFWTFIGTILLVMAVFEGTAGIIRAIIGSCDGCDD